VNCLPRMSSCGAITCAIGAGIGAGSVLWLASPLGWVVGVSSGAAIGGLVIGLASRRLLHAATACLAALADDDDHDHRSSGTVAGRAVPALRSAAFDAWVAYLHDLLVHLRGVKAEYSVTKGLVRKLAESMNGSQRSKEHQGRLESDLDAARPLLIFLDQFRRTTAQINRDLSALDEANERVAAGAHDQSEAVSRTAISVEALSDRIDRITQNSGEAANACELAHQEAQQGLEQVQNVIEGLDRLLNRIEANGRKIRRLEDRSSEIGVIVELIRGISNRTDMLALNATIESIRAGEHGRGFAIIADEIRKLAERAAAATREIGTLVEAIQADTQESIRGLSEEQAETQRESQRAREAGSSLARISQVVEKSARLVEGISRSTNDQFRTTQDLVRAMQRISDVTQQTQERTAQARAFIETLNQSCEPWQRLAALDPVLDAGASGAPGLDRRASDRSPPSNAGLLIPPSIESVHATSLPSVWSLQESPTVRHDSEREFVGSERSR
jgi:methyl-accepting chemotaxis protein